MALWFHNGLMNGAAAPTARLRLLELPLDMGVTVANPRRNPAHRTLSAPAPLRPVVTRPAYSVILQLLAATDTEKCACHLLPR
jgi:hypothetical protein